MAKVETGTQTKTVEVEEEVYVLTLTKREAQALHILTGQIGGNADSTARGVFSDRPDSIREQLQRAGIDPLYHGDNESYFSPDVRGTAIYWVKDVEV